MQFRQQPLDLNSDNPSPMKLFVLAQAALMEKGHSRKAAYNIVEAEFNNALAGYGIHHRTEVVPPQLAPALGNMLQAYIICMFGQHCHASVPCTWSCTCSPQIMVVAVHPVRHL